jgi:hypothetical protein
MEEFPKKSCAIPTYDKRKLKPQISSIFHFDWVSNDQIAHILGVKTLNDGTSCIIIYSMFFFQKQVSNNQALS